MLFSAVQVLAGEGVVVRSGDVVLWWEPGPTAGPDLPAQLVALVRSLAAEGPGAAAGAGPRLAETLRAGDAQALAGLVLALPSSSGLRVIVLGAGQVLANGVDIPSGWVDTELAWQGSMSIGRADGRLQPAVPGSPYDLVEGGTPGSGAAIVLAARTDIVAPVVASPVEAPAPESPAPEMPVHEEVAVETVTQEVAAAPPAPAQGWEPPMADASVVASAAAPAPAEAPPTVPEWTPTPEVEPPAPVAAMPGPPRFSPEPAPAAPLPAAPPPPTAVYGAIIIDDGSSWALDGDYVIGSNPSGAPEVVSGALRPLPLTDTSGQTHPAHAEVRHAEGGALLLVARAPTYLLAQGASAWQEAPLHQGIPLQPGVRVAVGQRTFTLAAPTWTGG